MITSIEPLASPTLEPIYCLGTWQDEQRIRQGKLDPNELDPNKRYAFAPHGGRSIGARLSDDDPRAAAATGSFKWCGFREVTPLTHPKHLLIPGCGDSSGPEEDFVFRVTPDHYDDMYVINYGAWAACQAEQAELMKPRERFTNAELKDAYRAVARTIVPITEYLSNYAQPVVLIKRHLDFDEVELVSGPRS